MNKPKLPTKGYLFSAGVLLLSLGVLVFQACKRSDILSRKTNFTVKEAKEWWYGSYRKSAAYTEVNKTSVFAAPENTSEKKYPSWKRAVSYKLGDFDVIEAPLVYETKRVLMPGMGDIMDKEEGRRVFKAANSKLLLFKKPDGTVEVRISTLVPTKEYARKKFYDLSDIHLNDIPKDFEGYQMIRKWDEEQINTYTLSKGKLRYKRKVKQLGKGNFNLTSDFKLIPKETIIPEVVAQSKTMQRSVQSKSSDDKMQSAPNTIAQLIEECRLVWVPRMVEVCIIVHEEDEPEEEVCQTYESDFEGDYELKCEMVWVPDEEPEDPCITYGINCPPGGGTTDPDPTDPNAPKDPCDEARKKDSIASGLLKDNTIKNSHDSLNSTVATDTTEKAYSFGADSSGNYKTTPIKGGTGYSAAVVVSSQFFTVYGGVHTHTNSAYDAFSAGDLYGFHSANSSNSNFNYMVALASDGTSYLFTITDPTLFNTFISTYSQASNYDALTHSWSGTSRIGDDFRYAFRDLRKQGYSEDAAYENAWAFIINEYKMGVSMSKTDANGDFKGIFVKVEENNLATAPLQITPGNPCNLKK